MSASPEPSKKRGRPKTAAELRTCDKCAVVFENISRLARHTDKCGKRAKGSPIKNPNTGVAAAVDPSPAAALAKAVAVAFGSSSLDSVPCEGEEESLSPPTSPLSSPRLPPTVPAASPPPVAALVVVPLPLPSALLADQKAEENDKAIKELQNNELQIAKDMEEREKALSVQLESAQRELNLLENRKEDIQHLVDLIEENKQREAKAIATQKKIEDAKKNAVLMREEIAKQLASMQKK